MGGGTVTTITQMMSSKDKDREERVEDSYQQEEENAYTERTRRQEISDTMVQAYTEYICNEGAALDYTALAVGEDWIRFSLLIHMVKPHNYARATDGPAHLVGRLFDNLLEQRPDIHTIIDTCRLPF